ncbi:MAG TPA: phosphoglucomutase/phosphomannomutase family protein [Pyrinomonadaceae bacterium]|nr:phosphoglucomutase/phosphomannomutase family protein [Pyrinomonadaceae bacterium]
MTNGLAQIRFGTDGWRAIIARDFTFANLERVAQAYADYLLSQSSEANQRVVVGFDRRFLSEQFAGRAAEVMAGNGFDTAVFQDAQPTPVISWAVKDLSAVGGIMITASHNPATFNGFKIKAPWGGSASPQITSAVEQLVDKTTPKRKAEIGSSSEHLETSINRYREHIRKYVDLALIRKANRRVVVDPMHGSAGTWVESFLQNGTLEVETIRSFRDPLFGGVNPEPIDQNLAALKKRVVETNAIVGLATDGDADRVGAVDENGRTLTMHDVVPMLLLHLSRQRNMSGAVAVTVSQSVLTKRIANAFGLKVHETPIGFKYIADLMLKENILLGAEESGGIGVTGHIPERDGVLNSLLFLEAIIAAGKTPSELLRDLHREFGEFYFGRKDIYMEVANGQKFVGELANNAPSTFAGEDVVNVQTMDGTKLMFKDESWILFRQSGTEPMLRIYAEATSVAKMQQLLASGAEQAHSKL